MGGKSSKVKGGGGRQVLERKSASEKAAGSEARLTEGTRVRISGKVIGQGRRGTITATQGNYHTVAISGKTRRIYHESDLTRVSQKAQSRR